MTGHSYLFSYIQFSNDIKKIHLYPNSSELSKLISCPLGKNSLNGLGIVSKFRNLSSNLFDLKSIHIFDIIINLSSWILFVKINKKEKLEIFADYKIKMIVKISKVIIDNLLAFSNLLSEFILSRLSYKRILILLELNW